MSGHHHAADGSHVHAADGSHVHVVGEAHSHDDGFRHTADGGPIVLDVGDDVGALVLHTGPGDVGLEIEISPVADPGKRHHVAVHPRYLGSRMIHAAVYPDLVEGEWQLWSPLTGEAALAVTVAGGGVTEAVWPG
jgi:hypothetical protein